MSKSKFPTPNLHALLHAFFFGSPPLAGSVQPPGGPEVGSSFKKRSFHLAGKKQTHYVAVTSFFGG